MQDYKRPSRYELDLRAEMARSGSHEHQYLMKEGFGFEVFDFKRHQHNEDWLEYILDLSGEIIFNLLLLPLLILMAPAIIGGILWENYRKKHPKRPAWMRD